MKYIVCVVCVRERVDILHVFLKDGEKNGKVQSDNKNATFVESETVHNEWK